MFKILSTLENFEDFLNFIFKVKNIFFLTNFNRRDIFWFY